MSRRTAIAGVHVVVSHSLVSRLSSFRGGGNTAHEPGRLVWVRFPFYALTNKLPKIHKGMASATTMRRASALTTTSAATGLGPIVRSAMRDGQAHNALSCASTSAHVPARSLPPWQGAKQQQL